MVVAISAVLLLCATASLVLRMLIVAPDILGFASSLTRDSPYFTSDFIPILQGGSIMNGPERARALRRVRIQIVDIRPEDETGHVALVPIDYYDSTKGTTMVGKVHRDRFYD
jgi:hypothetical protein